MKPLTTLTILFFLTLQVLKAQVWLDQYPTQNSFGHKKMPLSEIKGSPYLDTEYRTGKVITDDGAVYKDIPLRYNAYSDVLEFTKNGNSFDLIPKERVKRAEFGGQVFSYRSYEPGGKGYFEILQEGKATLLGRYVINFYEAEPLQGFAEPKPARFDDFLESYWISFQEAPAQKIVNAKKLVEILGDKKSEIQSYINKQRLSVKKVNDLKKIVTYYNSL